MAEKKPPSPQKTNSPTAPAESGLTGFIKSAGFILALSYPVLALSTGVRAVYQLIMIATGARPDDPYLPSLLSAVAALCYLTATIGFAVRRKWAWQLSVGVLAFESGMTVIIGVLSFTHPDLIGSTVWRHFGADYGYFPLVQPLIGLAWLFHPLTLQAYGIRRASA